MYVRTLNVTVRTLVSFSVKLLHNLIISHINVVSCQQNAFRALVSPSTKGVLLSALLRAIVIVFAFYLMYGFQPSPLWETDCDHICGCCSKGIGSFQPSPLWETDCDSRPLRGHSERKTFSPPLSGRLTATPRAGTFTQPALLEGNYQSCVDICNKQLPFAVTIACCLQQRF